jgi:hypothetical protein
MKDPKKTFRVRTVDAGGQRYPQGQLLKAFPSLKSEHKSSRGFSSRPVAKRSSLVQTTCHR